MLACYVDILGTVQSNRAGGVSTELHVHKRCRTVEDLCAFDFLLCSRAPLAAPCEETVLKIARLPSGGYFDIPGIALVCCI